MRDRSKEDNRFHGTLNGVNFRRALPALALRVVLLLAALLTTAPAMCGGQAEAPKPPAQLPEAPEPQVSVHDNEKKATGPCRGVYGTNPGTAAQAPGTAGGTQESAGTVPGPEAQLPPCPHPPVIDWFARFLTGPQVKPLTPKEKARLAVRNLFDPFNGITILGQSAIAVASDPHSPYGPGMPGFARNVGVSFTEDMTGEFFGTFLIPSIAHQDPHYHRMPNATVPRRIRHAITQVVWTQGDNGKGMLNYANLVGFAIDDEISNLYVPGEETNLPSSAARYSIGLASAPIDNFVTEFLPDVARRIHIRIVLVQRIIDQVAKTDGAASQ